MCVEVVLQVIQACKLLVTMLAGKRFLPLVYVQVPLVCCQVIKFFSASVAFIRTIA